MKSVLITAIFAVSIIQGQRSATAQNPNFVGDWTNVRPDTEPEGFTPAIRIFEDSTGLKAQAWGACKPRNCEWPAVRFWQLRDMTGKAQDRGFAEFPNDNKLAMRLEGNELVVEGYELSDVKINATKTRAQYWVMRYTRK